ncbi:hypothetical protein GCM10018793_54750 [Streptomyces sulfonofaciens]|uniref:Uncharacterized protein n=1 Tax=Streptomyces sulfonofaciens TaxID=68272 RepID=A0A919GJC2_9ACTN|nr:hypothetical protein [Streptomyces sulfonofaciens]GHH85702.1 hypothetical protein GCM10018793_54750 [Streptomyces sulfonofaciens]
MSFTRPDVWHAPATYWFWQRIPTREEIREQLDSLAAAGFGSFQIQTRLSFPRADYLGGEYLAACRAAADEAAARGLMMGLYDEYNWLSGHAGGRTVAGRDELRERHMFFTTARLGGAFAECAVDGIRATDVDHLLEPGRNWVFEGGALRWDEWEVVAALAHPEGTVDDAESVVDVTADAVLVQAGGSGCRVRVAAEALRGRSALTVFVAARCASSRMINYLLPEAAERFLEVGYEPYAAALGDHLGSTVRYVFFDQPHGCFFDWRGRTGHVGSSLMYAPAIVPADRRVLLALARDVGPRTAAWRCDFFERYASVGIDAFLGTLSAWCRAHGVALSGHEVLGYVSSWDPTSTIITDDPRTNFGTDYFGLDRLRDLTAVDARNEHPQISAKFGDSMARSHGRSGCLVEQYFARTGQGSHFAAGRWELTLGQLREQTVRHHLLGMRQLLTHAFWLTDGDDRDEVLANPRFDFPPGVNFEPWFGHHRAFADESGRLSEFLDGARPLDEIAVLYPLRTSWACGPGHPYGKHLAFWAEHLARGGYDFRLLDERELRAGPLPQGFTTLILPGVSVVADAATLDAVEEFAARGGSVLASGPLPSATQRSGLDARLTARTRALLGGEHGAYWEGVPSDEDVDARLCAALAGHTRVETDGMVWSRRGLDATGTRVALFNDDPGRRTVSVRPTGLPALVTRWNTADGTTGEPFEVSGDLRLTLDPGELVCVHLDPGPRAVPATRVLDAGWTLAVDDRVRPVDVYRGWERQGEETFSGVGEYRTQVALTAAEAAWPRWELLLPEVAASAEAEINGHRVGRWGWGPFRAAFGPGVLREGPNLLRIRVASTAANSHYAHGSQRQGPPDPSGLLRPPRLRPHLP